MSRRDNGRPVLLRTVRTPPATCPTCRATCSAASSASGATPTPGDVTVCLYCATVLAFTPALELRRATYGDLWALDGAARATLAQYRQSALDTWRRAWGPS